MASEMRDLSTLGELTPPDRTLMGPGPSDVHPRVLRAMSTPMVGHLDPYFLDVMADLKELLRYTFRTDNEHTLAVSGTGTAAMETAFTNLVEPGETVLVPSNGYFGLRMGEMAERAGGEAVHVDAPWGEPLDPADVEAAFAEHDPDVFGFVHGETSTGVCQTEVPELTSIAREHGAYTIADTVASLGGVEFRTDDWGVDVVYSGSQKCLSCPPGASPITFNDRAAEKVAGREEPPRCWYLDLDLLWGYWGEEGYHHTGPITMFYALREALRLVYEEGVEERWARHREVARGIKEGAEAMGLGILPDDDCWLHTLNAVRVPDGVDDGAVIDRMFADYGIEIVPGLGDLGGEIFRVGCMGHSARPANVSYLMTAFANALEAEGADVDADAGVAAARAALGE